MVQHKSNVMIMVHRGSSKKRKENDMFTITEEAQAQVATYFEGKEIQPVRLLLTQGCGGGAIVMALDAKKEGDQTFSVNNIDYIMDADFLKEAAPIIVDFSNSGFVISSNLKLGGGCSECGSGGSCSTS